MIKPWPHQITMSTTVLEKLREYGICYISAEERTGKSLTAILAAEESLASRVLIASTGKALEDWDKLLNEYIHLNSYTLVSYTQLHKLKMQDFDLAIVDEPHTCLGGYPKPTKTNINLKKFVYNIPIIYISATSHAQGAQLLYNQFAISCYSPFIQHKSFYEFYKKYANRDKNGDFRVVYVSGNNTAVDYKAVQHDKIFEDCKHLFVSMTRKQCGFEKEPEDEIHYVKLKDSTKELYNMAIKDRVLDFSSSYTGEDHKIVVDSPTMRRVVLHMIEGGVLKAYKVTKRKGKKPVKKAIHIPISNKEKIDYILQTWGDTKDIVIMYNYIGEGIKLREVFKNAQILQGDTYAEGVDLSMYKHLIIYSQNHRVSKHTQRRARQAHKNRTDEIKVHFLLVKGAVSDKIYKDVSKNKKDHVDKIYEQLKIDKDNER